jgi:hypothetical protein
LDARITYLECRYNGTNAPNDEPTFLIQVAMFKVQLSFNRSGLSWSNLEGYYQMTQSTDLNGFLIDKTSNLRNGKLIGNCTTRNSPSALYLNSTYPTSGTWTNGSVWSIPNTLGVDGSTYIDWNIVKTTNNITTETKQY